MMNKEKITIPKSLAQVRKEIQKKYPHLDITRNHDESGTPYYYFFSDDDETALTVCSNYTTSVWISRFDNISLEAWLFQADQIMNKTYRGE